MVTSQAQASETSLSFKPDQSGRPVIPRRSNSLQSISDSDLTVENSLTTKLQSGLKWVIHPFQQYCSSKTTTTNNQTSKSLFDSRCLKPEFNRVDGLLKYFTFGVMFTNSILGFIVFFIGLWSSFEHRKINHMPTVDTQATRPISPFNFIGIILCIFGLSFFLLCIISCLGINRENLNLLRISLIGQFLTLIIFLISAVLIFMWGETIRRKIGETMMIGLKVHYHIDEAWTAFFDKLHMSYFCCVSETVKSVYEKEIYNYCYVNVDYLGVYSFSDWNENPNYACTASNVRENFDACSVPFTCCKTPAGKNTRQIQTKYLAFTCGSNILSAPNQTVNLNEIHERININGCFDEILPIIQQLVITAAIFMLLICIIIFITIFLTCLLTFEIRLTLSDVKRYCRKKRHTALEDYSERGEETF